MIHFIYFVFTIIILELYYYYNYIKRRKYIRNYKHLIKNCNNNEMTQYYLKKLLTSELYFNEIGKFCNKDTKELSYLEISQLIHTNIYGKQRKCTLDELIEYKTIILNFKNTYQQDNNIFHSNNINTKMVSGLGHCGDFYKPIIIKIILWLLHNIFDIYIKYYLGYNIYYDNLSHYKYYSKKINKDKPIHMFFHGLGLGIPLYINLINEFDGENIVYVDVPYLSLRKEFDYLDDRMLHITFENYIRQNGIKEKINLIGHSYGGIIIQKLLNNYESLIDKIYLIESPVFLINVPHGIAYIYHKKFPFLAQYLIRNELNIIQIFLKSDTVINQAFNLKNSSKCTCFFAELDEVLELDKTIQELKSDNIKYYTYIGTHGEIIINKKNLHFIKTKIFIS